MLSTACTSNCSVFSSQRISKHVARLKASHPGTLKAPRHLHAAVRTLKAWVFCTRWIVWTLMRPKDSAKNQTSCGPCVLPRASCKANVESKAKNAPMPRSPSCFTKAVDGLPWPLCQHPPQPTAASLEMPEKHPIWTSKPFKPPLQTLASVDTQCQQQKLTQRLDTLKTDMSNLVSALLLAPEAAAICKGLWPCLGDRVLGFSVHCGQVCFVVFVGLVVTLVGLMFSRSSPSRSPTCWSARATCHFHLLQAWQRRFLSNVALCQFAQSALSRVPISTWFTGLSKRFKTGDLLICSGNGGNTWQGPCNVNLSLASEKELGAKRQHKHKRVRTKLSYTFPRVFLSQNSRFITKHQKIKVSQCEYFLFILVKV